MIQVPRPGLRPLGQPSAPQGTSVWPALAIVGVAVWIFWATLRRP